MIALSDPDLQIDFATSLASIRTSYLQGALLETIRHLNIPEVDGELAKYVPPGSLSSLASHGLRGELMFPVPKVLAANPKLLGYYRLLYGYSQKEFYKRATGLTTYRAMEMRGVLNATASAALPELCEGLCSIGALLLGGLNPTAIDADLLDDLTLLTLGPQLRGGANVKKGSAGIRTVFNAIHQIVQHATTMVTDTRIEVTNAAGRAVVIQFAADPDIVIVEAMAPGSERKVIAIEVKAGSDFSNIHNRIGEAEKSHIKARAVGFTECWTVVNVDAIDLTMARRESPSTNQFYKISDIVSATGPAYEDFVNRIISLTGVSTAIVAS